MLGKYTSTIVHEFQRDLKLTGRGTMNPEKRFHTA